MRMSAPHTEQGERIASDLMPQWWEHFNAKNKDYGDAPHELGAKGEYAELYKKMRKLKRGLWDGEELAGEQVDEVLLDMIAHCFLALDMLSEGK